jgi:hypothetical protein
MWWPVVQHYRVDEDEYTMRERCETKETILLRLISRDGSEALDSSRHLAKGGGMIMGT